MFQEEHKRSSDSDSTIILDLITAETDMDTSVPELRRTDSVIVRIFVSTTHTYIISADS